MQIVEAVLMWFSILSVGIMAGVYFAFSAFLMRSLDALEHPQGILAMQAINRVILRSPFLPLFFASTGSCAILAVWGGIRWGEPGAWQMALGGAVYVVGMFLVTATGNVPLNTALDRADTDADDADAIWRNYLRRWTAWNHVRTVACVISLALLVLALLKAT